MSIRPQVFHLQQASIECEYMSGTGGWEAQRAILDRLRQPAPSLRILFMTPEKIARSDTLMRALHELRGRGLLDRIIVDEAHCVSNWGHVRYGPHVEFALSRPYRRIITRHAHQSTPSDALHVDAQPESSHDSVMSSVVLSPCL